VKIYAIRDRLIDYFMQPFVGPDDKNVLASVARLVNQGEVTSDIQQAPHHFEVWQLGQVTEDGHLVPERALIADCSSLVRRGIRAPGEAGPGEGPLKGPQGQSTGAPSGARESAGALHSPVQNAPQAEAGAVEEVRGRFGRGTGG